MAASDSFVAVFDAKYAYEFWRPVTAILNGVRRHVASARGYAHAPGVPCAHCISAGAVGRCWKRISAKARSRRVDGEPDGSWCDPALDAHRRLRAGSKRRARVGVIHYLNSTRVGEDMEDRSARSP